LAIPPYKIGLYKYMVISLETIQAIAPLDGLLQSYGRLSITFNCHNRPIHKNDPLILI